MSESFYRILLPSPFHGFENRSTLLTTYQSHNLLVGRLSSYVFLDSGLQSEFNLNLESDSFVSRLTSPTITSDFAHSKEVFYPYRRFNPHDPSVMLQETEG